MLRTPRAPLAAAGLAAAAVTAALVHVAGAALVPPAPATVTAAAFGNGTAVCDGPGCDLPFFEALKGAALYSPTSTATDAESNMQEILKFVELRNRLVLWMLPEAVRAQMGPFLKAWFANGVLGYIQFFLTTVPWSAFIYVVRRGRYVPVEQIPTWEAMWKQVLVSVQALPLYTALPAATEVLVRNGWTRVYGSVAQVGWPMYFTYLALYMLSVEYGVYWMHRELHDCRFLYKALHYTHHIYNKEHTLSPFAGLAFNPIDGILQAVPYVWTLFFVPCHMMTHEMLLFGTALWTASIHDCIDGKCEPIMGAGYHTIHHTKYNVNYGHYTILFDWMFGTLLTPEEHAASVAAKPSKAAKAQ